MHLLAVWQVGQVLWSLIWITLFFLWIMLVIRVFSDIFRSKDLGGFSKVLWLLFVVITPYIGVFVYLIARGGKMAERELNVALDNEAAVRAYIRNAAGGDGGSASGIASELERLETLRTNGTIDDAEFARLKAKVLG